MKSILIPLAAGAVAAFMAVPAQAGPWRDLMNSYQQQQDLQEDYFDQQIDHGPLDRREDRLDRWLDRREARGRTTPRAARRWERRSQRYQMNTGAWMNGGVRDHHAGQSTIQPMPRPRGNGRIREWREDHDFDPFGSGPRSADRR